MNNLQTFHRQFPNHSLDNLLAEAKELFLKNEQAIDCSSGYAKVPHKSFVKARMIVQDNGYSPHYTPLSHDVINMATGEKANLNFLFCEDIKDPWKFGDKKFTNLIEKQRHCCILVPLKDGYRIFNVDLSLSCLSLSDTPSVAKEFIEKKLPGVPSSMVVALKTATHEVIPLNQIIDVFGIIEFPIIPKEDDDQLDLENYIPTIQCIHYSTYSPGLYGHFSNGESILSKMNVIAAVRDEAISTMQSLLLGDRLAAEYLYVSLFSKITKRVGGIATGSINLNFYHPSVTSLHCSKLMDFIHKLTPISVMLPLSIDSLNNSLWMQPHQNRFQTDEYGLCRGELQACDGTFFLLDECGMDTGTLVERGILNIKALQEAMELGKVDYGLAFGNISRDCDFRFSILGKSKSVLSPAFSMELIPNLACSQSHNVLESADVLQGLFLAMNSIKFEVDEVMMERVHSDFAKSQQLKRDAKEPTDDGTALLNRLILAENIAKSFGMTSMDVKSWEEAGSMEMQRFERVTKVLN